MNAKYPRSRKVFGPGASVASLGLALSLALAGTGNLAAAPTSSPAIVAMAQNVDYISPDAAYVLDLGFPVLVPGWVPAPFGGPPSIDTGGGYYGLYWMNVGGGPTFLHVTGQVGGSLPAGSPYDLNNELFINANVQGYDAIRDVTPIYDAVWWIAGGVLYKVESQNSSVDSLSLANSLIYFQAPSAPEPEPTWAPEPEPTWAPEPEPTWAPDPEPTVPPPAPDSGVETPVVQEPDAGEAPQNTPVSDPASGDGTESAGLDGTDAGEELPPVSDDGTGQSTVNSDGTGGAPVSVIGGDGTGGTADVYVPRRPTPGEVTP